MGAPHTVAAWLGPNYLCPSVVTYFVGLLLGAFLLQSALSAVAGYHLPQDQQLPPMPATSTVSLVLYCYLRIVAAAIRSTVHLV